MSNDARKKEKQRLKRQKKKESARRAASASPLRRIATSGLSMECWIGADWRETGLADIIIWGAVPGGSGVIAGFLVDLTCVGLKDAWGRRNMTRSEFRDDVLAKWERGRGGIEQIDLQMTRRLVAGAMRFSRQNGFRLPPHFERWTPILGELGDIAEADLSEFGAPGGELHYVGTLEFLRQRLIGSTPDVFLARPDVKWMMPAEELDIDQAYVEDDEDAEDDEDVFDAEDDRASAEALASSLKATINLLVDRVRQWCFGRHVIPSRLLEQGVTLMLTKAAWQSLNPDADADREVSFHDAIDLLSVGIPEADREEIALGMLQVSEYMKDFKTPEEMLESIGAEALETPVGELGPLPPVSPNRVESDFDPERGNLRSPTEASKTHSPDPHSAP